MKSSLKQTNWIYVLSGFALLLLVLLIKQTAASRVEERWHWGTAESDKYLAPVVYGDILEFIALEQSGENDLLIARKQKDTVTFICNLNEPVQLERGDQIRLQWKWEKVVSAENPKLQEWREFAIDFKLLKPGQLSHLIRKGFYRLKPSNSVAAISDYRKHIIEYNLKYYLANSNDQKIRKIVDEGAEVLYYKVTEKVINGLNAYELSLTPDQSSPESVKNMYFLPEHPFDLLEYGDFF